MKSLFAMVALVLVGSFQAANAAEFQQMGLAKRAVALVVVQQTDQKIDKQAAKGAEIAKSAAVWKYTMAFPRTQTNGFAAQELATLTTYINAASGTDVTTALARDPKSREYLIEVSLKQQWAVAGDLMITPDIPGLEAIEVDSQCPKNTHYVVTFAKGTKPTEEQLVKLSDLVRFMATINHGLDSKTEALVINGIDPRTEGLTTKPIMKPDGTMSIVVTFPATAFEQQRIISQSVPVVSAF